MGTLGRSNIITCTRCTITAYIHCQNKIIIHHVVKSYYLPRLLYGCEGTLLRTLQTRELDIIWNNAFRYIFNCCWRESVKPIQFYCNTVPLSYMYIIDERKLLFYRKISLSRNVILRTLMCLPGVSSDNMFQCSKYMSYLNQR